MTIDPQPKSLLTPFKWIDPSTLPPIGMTASGPALDEIDPKIMGWVRQAIAAREIVEAEPAPANDNRRSAFIDAQTLLGLEFEPIKYVIPGYVAEGLTILGGRPKLGKSWLALDWVVAVASGGLSLGVRCQQGDAFYLALEDNQRRLQDRLRIVLPKLKSLRPDLSRLSLLTAAPKIGEGLIEAWDAWRTRAEDPRLIVVDTLAMVRPRRDVTRTPMRPTMPPSHRCNSTQARTGLPWWW